MEFFEAGMALWNKGKKMAALQYFEKFAAEGSLDASGVLGELYVLCHMDEDARRAFAIAVESKNSNTEFQYGLLLDRHGEKEEAEKYFELAGQHGNWRGYLQLAKNSEFLDSIVGTDLAKAHYMNAVKSGAAEVFYEFGMYLMKREETLDGLDFLEKAALKNSQPAVRELARLAKKMGDEPTYQAFFEKGNLITQLDLEREEFFEDQNPFEDD